MGHALQPWLRHMLALDTPFLIQSLIALEILPVLILGAWPDGRSRKAASLVAFGILVLPVLAFSDNDQSAGLALLMCAAIALGLWMTVRVLRLLGVRL